MNGRRAKALRRLAGRICDEAGISRGKGHNAFVALKNRVFWKEPSAEFLKKLKEAGLPTDVKEPVKGSGTIIHNWVWYRIYRSLKKNVKRRTPGYENLGCKNQSDRHLRLVDRSSD